ncbi:type II toxin-antitoxin system death-on-curing family toxin [Marinoscillum sp.]|uniref:type II toxin-antitoxin system death-on-curing family toxin n=1 Tax=Marinoscillum sp. TaxID=2024838 RepID=UPI003BAAF072
MISKKEVLAIHSILIEQFGGSNGVRDQGLLESAIERPFQTFDGKELYPDSTEKAAAILESIVKNHPFIDGNKRTGYVLARLLLMNNNRDIEATEDQKYELVIGISTGELGYEAIKQWIKNHSS